MPDRPGLLGEADRSTLFLDEIGELPAALQARLLRVMDCGEYQRLGEARRRTTDVRLIAATNRDPAVLKHDLLARFAVRVRVPGFAERPDDIPLIARHLVRRLLAADPAARARLCAGDEPRLALPLVAAAVRRGYTTHARELSELLLRALAASPGATLDAPPEPAAAPSPPPASDDDDDPTTPTRAQLLAALERCDGVRDRAWRELGLTSRYQLKRLLKRHNIA
jgi:DNA-binding NtrC family response regulator